MEHASSSHDNVDVKVNNRINVYGNVSIVGSISLVGVGFLFLGIWMFTHWQAAVVLSSVVVYGLVALFGLTVLAFVAAIWIRFVVSPATDAYERRVGAQGQEMRNRLIHAQENAVIIEMSPGQLQVVPLLPAPQVVEATAQEPTGSKEAVLELFEKGLSLRDIAKATNLTYYQVQKITAGKGG